MHTISFSEQSISRSTEGFSLSKTFGDIPKALHGGRLFLGLWRCYSLPFLLFGPLRSGYTPRGWECSPFCIWFSPYRQQHPRWSRAVGASGGAQMVARSLFAVFTDCPYFW